VKLIALGLIIITTTASAEEPSWNTSWNGTFYGYLNGTTLQKDSVLNPVNQIANLATQSETVEARLNFKAESDELRLIARPIFTASNQSNNQGKNQKNEGYLSQWQVRLRATEGWNIAAGREVLNWGAAQFRSPSSPFYFDNGRLDPMRELVGMDTAKFTWTPDMQKSLTLARVFGAGRVGLAEDAWRNSWLLKADQRGDGYALGLVVAKAALNATFYGAHGQVSMNDDTLFYAELGSSEQLSALQSPDNSSQPFSVLATSPRRNTMLTGISYTLLNGQSLAAEYLHDEHGFTATQESAYFARAASTAQLAGEALSLAPRLLGRDYLHLVWQSNFMESDGYWRVMFTRNLTDNGNDLGAYGETILNERLTTFATALVSEGSSTQEASSLITLSLTIGLKLALH
jgi:hypothetical protein